MLRSCIHNFDNTWPHQGSVIRNNLFTGCQERAITATGGEVGGGNNVMVYNNVAINSGAIDVSYGNNSVTYNNTAISPQFHPDLGGRPGFMDPRLRK